MPDPDKKAQFTKTVLLSLGDPTIKRLKEIIDEGIRELEATRSDDYESASWAYKQADMNGARRTLRKIKDLITI